MAEEKKWGWLPSQMPGVAKLIGERRTKDGADHVKLCWQRGVVEAQPGWFFAREGSLAVGTPWNDDPVIAQYATGQLPPTSVFLCMRPPQGVQA